MSKHVRITLEGPMQIRGLTAVEVEIEGIVYSFGPDVRASKGFKLEEIEAPLAVGDVVYRTDHQMEHGAPPTGPLLAVFDFAGATWAAVGFSAHFGPSNPVLLDLLRRA